MGKNRRMNSLVRWLDRLNDYFSLVAGAVIAFTALIVIYEVVMRYLVKRPTTWVNDISEILLVYCTFLGAAWVLRVGGHIKVDIVVTMMKKRRRMLMGIIQDILSLFFCVVFTWITWDSFWDSIITQERTAGGLFSVSLWTVYIVIPVGGLLLSLQLIRQIVDGFAYLSKSHPEKSNVERGT